MKLIKKIGKYFLLILIGLIAIMLFKTIFTKSKQIADISDIQKLSISDSSVSRLSAFIKLPTITFDDSVNSKNKINNIQLFFKSIEKNFPIIHKKAAIKYIGDASILIEIKGKNTQLKPALFLAHLDVVPVEKTDEKNWRFPPFSGAVVKDTIWGRGTLDDKFCVLALLESVEIMLQENKIPERSILLAFGQDEEKSGTFGARKIATYLEENKIIPECIMDEGMGITHDIVPGINKPVAIIGLAEKGFVTLKLSTKINGGHSSMPKENSAIKTISAAVNKIENFQFTPTFTQPMKQFFEIAAPEMNFGYKFLFSNLWITKPLVISQLLKNEKTAASIRTVHATTIFNAGIKENSIPTSAYALINFRNLPGHTSAQIKTEIEQLINDKNIEVSIMQGNNEASPETSTEHFMYKHIQTTVKQVFGDVVVIPGQVLAGTDCKNYAHLCTNIFRFVPLLLYNKNIGSIHGNNEYITVKNYKQSIDYYYQLMLKL